MNVLANNFLLQTSYPRAKELVRSELSIKVFKISLLVFIITGTAFYRNNLTLLIKRSYKIFRGEEGGPLPLLMLSTYLALKISTHQGAVSLKKIPQNFAIGVRQLFFALRLSVKILICTRLVFKLLSIKDEPDPDYVMKNRQASLFKFAVQDPFWEELFTREFIQGSLNAALKLINEKKKLQLQERSICQFSRIVSAATFGLAHSQNSLTQGIITGVGSYYYEAKLYEKKGFFAAFGLHFAYNGFLFLFKERT